MVRCSHAQFTICQDPYLSSGLPHGSFPQKGSAISNIVASFLLSLFLFVSHYLEKVYYVLWVESYNHEANTPMKPGGNGRKEGERKMKSNVCDLYIVQAQQQLYFMYSQHNKNGVKAIVLYEYDINHSSGCIETN